MRFILDTNVLVAALRSPTGASAALLRAVRAGRATMLASLSLALALEYQDVLSRPEIIAGTELTSDDAAIFATAAIAIAEPVVVRFRLRPQLTDPGDEHVLEAAVNGGADALVTFNLRDFAGPALRFGLRTATPAPILRDLERPDA